MPFLLRDIIDDKITNCFVLLVEWYKSAIRAKSHTAASLYDMRKSGIT